MTGEEFQEEIRLLAREFFKDYCLCRMAQGVSNEDLAEELKEFYERWCK